MRVTRKNVYEKAHGGYITVEQADHVASHVAQHMPGVQVTVIPLTTLNGARVAEVHCAERDQRVVAHLVGLAKTGGIPDPTAVHDPLEGLDDMIAEVAKPTYDELAQALRRLEPHLDKLICYASTADEYEPNAIVRDVLELIKRLP